jgi:hypothetical protein
MAALKEKPADQRHQRREAEDQRDDVPDRGIDDASHQRLEEAHADHHGGGGQRRQRDEHPRRRHERPRSGGFRG